MNRFPPIAGTDGLLTQAEVTRILAEALKIANRARAQIRQPFGSAAQVTYLGRRHQRRSPGTGPRPPDAPVFGTDVALQKARTALLFSQPERRLVELLSRAAASSYLAATPTSAHPRLRRGDASVPRDPSALTNGIAYSNRAIGNLARPFLPGWHQRQRPPGPLSKPYASVEPVHGRPATRSRA